MRKARQYARRNIDVFEKLNLDAIVINAAGCGSTLKEYGRLLRDDPRYAERAAAFSKKVKDLSEFLVTQETAARGSRFTAPNQPLRVTFHDACHLAHAQGIKSAPRQLLRSVEGIELVELNESDVCCGSAGSYNLTEPKMADQLQRRKIENIRQTGVKVIITTNPGCILQIQEGLQKAGLDVRVVHIAEFLDQL